MMLKNDIYAHYKVQNYDPSDNTLTKSKLLVRTDTRKTISKILFPLLQIKQITERNIWLKSTKMPKVKKSTLVIFALKNSRNHTNWVVIYVFIL